MLLGQGPHFEKQDSKSFSKTFVLLQQEFEGRDPCAQHVPGSLEGQTFWHSVAIQDRSFSLDLDEGSRFRSHMNFLLPHNNLLQI